ncbi:MAG: hypothetical protein J6N76_06935 [Lachnospiraceae bacterium]|nr:hypothetical protein [Lachnospiraceae bacterium]
MIRKRIMAVTMIAAAAISMTGCSGQKSPAEEASDAESATEAATENETTTGTATEAEAETAAAQAATDEATSLPAYSYPKDDAVLSAVCDYMINTEGAYYEKSDVAIPYVVEVARDEQDENDIKIWGDFWILNYDLSGTVLMNTSGGSYPGKFHIKKISDTEYEVVDFEKVEDGAGFNESAKRIFGDNYDAFMKAYSDSDLKEQVRAEYIRDYVEANGLNIDSYQDYGWDSVAL